LDVAGGRYEWIGRMVRAAVVRPRLGLVRLTDRLDRIAAHPTWELILLLGLFGGTFGITYGIGTPIQEWLDAALIQGMARTVRTALEGWPPWLVGLMADGVIGGAGMVLTFLPILAMQMLFIPCAATLATIRSETGGWGWTASSVALLAVVSFGVGIGIYQAASLLGLGL
jgi:Fe2+ transport system protein B